MRTEPASDKPERFGEYHFAALEIGCTECLSRFKVHDPSEINHPNGPDAPAVVLHINPLSHTCVCDECGSPKARVEVNGPEGWEPHMICRNVRCPEGQPRVDGKRYREGFDSLN